MFLGKELGRRSRVPIAAAAICLLIVIVAAIGIGVVALQPSQAGSSAPGGLVHSNSSGTRICTRTEVPSGEGRMVGCDP
jgi:hypothetical protein